MVKIGVKRLHPKAVIPKAAHPGDLMDITATSIEIKGNQVKYGTGLAFDFPVGWAAKLYPRSSIYKYNLSLSNSVGCVDQQYRGEIMFIFNMTTTPDRALLYPVGDRIGQIEFVRLNEVELVEVTNLSETDRGAGGFGSTGN